MSRSKDISMALYARLAEITVANGYLTDVGARVFRGRRRLDESHIPCSTIVEGADNVQDQSAVEAKVVQRYVLEAHSACDPNHPNDTAHDILVDLKRAVFGGPKKLGGLVRLLSYVGRSIGGREDGEALIFASIEIDAEFSDDLAAAA